MIQINATTHTTGGLTVNTGSLLDVNPHVLTRIENGLTKYNVAYDVTIYKDMAGYQAGQVLVKSTMKEYNVAHVENNVDIQGLNAQPDFVNALLRFLQTAIENGEAGYSGVGAGKTALVYPPIVKLILI